MKFSLFYPVFRSFYASIQKPPDDHECAARRCISFLPSLLGLAMNRQAAWDTRQATHMYFVWLFFMLFVRESVWFLELVCVNHLGDLLLWNLWWLRVWWHFRQESCM